MRNFHAGIIYEEAAAVCFSAETGATLSECGMFVLTFDNRFTASPDRSFDGKACSMLTNVNTGEKNPLAEQCFLETKTREEGQTGPLFSVTASDVCQTELQMKCVGHKRKLLFFNLLCQSLRNQSTFLAGPFHYVTRSLDKYKIAEM